MRCHIITFGCQMQESDSERIASSLEKTGYQPTSKMEKADLILVNMCSVRQSAVDRIFGLSQKLAKLKEKNSKLKTILTGCVLKKDEIKFKNKFDSILNIKDIIKLPEIISIDKKRRHCLVPISSGCNNFCSYCVVPLTRGPLVCLDHKKILKEVKNAVKKGVKEIWLLGQNVNRYCSKPKTIVQKTEGFWKLENQKPKIINFAKLLKMVNDIPGDFWVRFTSPNPADFSDELIEVIANSEKIAKYLHLPVQSGDNEILKKMNRRYTAEEYKNLVKKIRKKIPDVNLSTDVIVGFPGETKKQFENTVKLFKEMKFNIAYIAKYSPRPGTAAFKMKDDVSLAEKKKREKVLRKIIERV